MKPWLKELFSELKNRSSACAICRPCRAILSTLLPRAWMWVYEQARAEMLALQEGGVDGILFSNEFSLPYLTKVEMITVASMAALIGEMKQEIKIPYGVNVLWDPRASIDVAMATGAQFVREIFTGVYASDFGLWNTNVGEVIRHQQAVGAGHVRLLL
jgi:uncharacterized protein